MTFFHHTMTDRELIRAAEACEGQHLRMLADRLATRATQLATIARLSDISPTTPPTADNCLDRLQRIQDTATE